MSVKWMKARPEMLVKRVSRRALRERFREVLHHLPLAAKKPCEDVEHVHRLRVACRRAVAALDIFEPALPPKRARRMRKELRRLRRAVGQARDLDVLAQRLERLLAAGENGAISKVLQRVVKLRKKAQPAARQAYRRARRRQLGREMRRLAKRSRHPAGLSGSFGSYAREGLRRNTRDFFAAAGADLTDIENLHQLRIAGKRLRYAMEIYAGAFSSALRYELYPVFAEVQERLGTINDYATAVRLLDTWQQAVSSKSSAGRMQNLLEDENRRLEKAAAAFRQWWTPARAASLKHQFDQLVAGPQPAEEREKSAAERKIPLSAARVGPSLVSSVST
ncbi:MAG: CHAD domain-containing protein [Planctomycetales bacterium]|nr:CHAD domain-containing protein [Planctomycetales bacterium]NIM08218.1 CHAD domain-containing protein [Planctomycetales bacterium]NIN07712.1 CHAD domain-containing protein [Planctomycetales bacterium]NIN76838.1 CHAD domain-containing protein [Planctomycetales bacterium]NIO34034.1 CHAD domain-containing protein [Planctomycetales bacterium]